MAFKWNSIFLCVCLKNCKRFSFTGADGQLFLKASNCPLKVCNNRNKMQGFV